MSLWELFALCTTGLYGLERDNQQNPIWTFHTTNIDVLQKIGVKEATMINNVKTERCLMRATHRETHQGIMILCKEDWKANEEERDQDEHGSTI